MSAERVAARTEGPVLHLTLDRPEKRNAIDEAMVRSLLGHLETARLSADVHVVALRGAGTDFCAGADLHELLASVDRSAGANVAAARQMGQVFLRMRELPKPVVAIVHGRALAGGCGLATACDMILARDDAVFGYPEVHRGFVPAMVLAMLRRAVGEKAAFDLVASGRSVSAAEALRMGLVSRVVPAASFETDVARMVAELAGLSASAVALTKRQLYAVDTLPFAEAIDLGAEVNALARGTPDFRAAVARFFKR